MPTQITKQQWLVEQIHNHKSDECLLWKFAKDSHGYGVFGFARLMPGLIKVHRYSFFVTHGRWPSPVARHTCDNPPCFNPRHIIEGTKAENAADMMERNRHVTQFVAGEKHPFAILTNELVVQMRNDHSIGLGCRKLARKYGVDERRVKDIINRRAWTNI